MQISDLVATLRARKTQGVALDIDETLADSNPHWLRAMYAFAPPPGRSFEDIRQQHKFAEDVPEWRTPQAYARIHALLHSNEFHADIPLIPDALESAREIHETVGITAYITARPEAVRAGTLTWLERHGFPSAPVIMRDEDVDISAHGDGKNGWKARMLAAAYPSIWGIVDDNPGLTRTLRQVNYPGTLFLYGPQWQPTDPSPTVVLCPTWDDVVSAVRIRSCAW
ncbi:MAG: hypothetical protein IT406_01185 [Candidatus Yanofskybacteria bacterium]|nr:hypothetical protein [Candidatus Yanofskybacteria bacterium]